MLSATLGKPAATIVPDTALLQHHAQAPSRLHHVIAVTENEATTTSIINFHGLQMPPPTSEFQGSLSLERIRHVLRDCYSSTPNSSLKSPEFTCSGTGFEYVEGKRMWYEKDDRRRRAIKWCKEYYSIAVEPQAHLFRIDAAFSDILSCQLPKLQNEDVIVKYAFDLLSRLPAEPVELPDARIKNCYESLPQHYLLPETQSPIWSSLRVVTYWNTNSILFALGIVMAPEGVKAGVGFSTGSLHTFLDTTMELLEMALELSQEARTRTDVQTWFVVRAFLWTSWQRCMMLLLWYDFGEQLSHGYGERRYSLARRRISDNGPSSRKLLGKTREQDRKVPIPGYMCKWAFELLRTDRAAVGMDFRRLHERYSDLFGNRPPRCVQAPNGQLRQCDGLSVDHCQRFKGLKIIDQSAHVPSCPKATGCRPIYWDEESYRSIQGARAVSLVEHASDQLKYCPASQNTLAISHVWSHGQGGRPEPGGTGFNRCLHRRYIDIARRLGCDSYWMDTLCIPQDHQLRAEAIDKINEIFTRSKVTLVCDRDLMEIDVTNLSDEPELQESLLAALLVCDWNVRAWTLLEAMRGRQNIYLLCKDDNVVSAKDTLSAVHRVGRIDIAILFSTCQHLIPWEPYVGEDPRRVEMYPVDLPEAAILLSHRHASRPGDDIVIWSLLCHPKASYSVEKLYEQRIGTILRTGFLMSGYPRIQNRKGRSWAPSQPRLLMSDSPLTSSKSRRFANAYDGEGSGWGFIREHGFDSSWAVYEIGELDTISNLKARLLGKLPQLILSTRRQIGWSSLLYSRLLLWDIEVKYLRAYRWAALLQPSSHGPLRKDNVAVLYRGSSDGILLAVVASNDQVSWEWKGLYEWPKDIPLLDFELKMITLV
jgi:hypothetical protein